MMILNNRVKPEGGLRLVGNWVAGTATDPSAGRRLVVHDPATGAPTAEVQASDVADVDQAVAAAAEAFRSWSRTPLSKRSRVLFRMRDLVEAHTDDLALAITTEHGKVLSDAAGEVARGLENLEFACGVGHLLKGAVSWDVNSSIDVSSMREPLGVVAGISPFNFPAMVPLWMCSSAIACGNAFILKPSEKDPTTAMLLAELWAEAGLPAGVFSVVHGDATAVDRLLEHPDVAAVSFVGSTNVARHVYATAAQHGKRVQALGGAKNHMVVLPDADLDQAADAAISAGFGSAGERCMAISVLVAVGDIADDLIAKIVERMAAVQVGDGREPDTAMGPLITAEHRDRVASYLEPASIGGGRVVVDGRAAEIDGAGFFLAPSLVDGVVPGTPVYDDEIFGPVLGIARVATLAEALELVNGSPYGNGTAIFTSDGNAAQTFVREVEAGMVGVNVPIPVPVGFYSFGGRKSSLFGDLHIYGPESIQFWTRGKVVTSRWSGRDGVDLSFRAR